MENNEYSANFFNEDGLKKSLKTINEILTMAIDELSKTKTGNTELDNIFQTLKITNERRINLEFTLSEIEALKETIFTNITIN